MNGKSKAKGSAFERKVAKILSEALDTRLERTPLSGGWGKMQTKGDIVGPNYFPYHVECKKQEGWTLDCLFSGKGIALIDSWWTQTIDQCPVDKIPLLVFSRNRFPIYVRTVQEVHSDRVLRLGDSYVMTLDTFLKEIKRC